MSAALELEQLPAGRHFLTDQADGRWSAVFARVSTSDQVKDGWSLKQQVNSGTEAARRDGNEVTVVYVDPGKSASRLTFDQRDGVRTLLNDIRQGSIAVLYMYKRDRVARQSGEWLHFWKACRKHGVQIRFTCPQEPPIGKGIYGKVQEAFMSLWAELESEQIRTRVKDSILSRFQNGEWVGGVLPLGLTRGPDNAIIPHEDEAPLVQEIYRLAYEDGLGPQAIARHLNDSRPLSRRGLAWSRDAVNAILENRTYCGYLRLRMTVEDEDEERTVQSEMWSPNLPTLVSEEVWNSLAEQRKSRQRRAGYVPTRYDDSPNLLAGIVICAECGRPMAARHPIRRYKRKDGSVAVYRSQAYYCRNAKNGETCRSTRGVSKSAVEEAVLRQCFLELSNIPADQLLGAINTYLQEQMSWTRTSLAGLRSRLGQTDTALQRNRVAVERCTHEADAGFYRARITELLMMHRAQSEEVSKAEARLRQVKALRPEVIRHPESWESFQEVVGQAPSEVLRMLLVTALEQVRCAPGEQRADLVFHYRFSGSS